MNQSTMDLDDSLEGHLVCATREHLLSRLSALLLLAVCHLRSSRVQTWMKKRLNECGQLSPVH